MMKLAFYALLFFATALTAVVSGIDAALANSRNEDIASTFAFNGMYRISQVCRSCHHFMMMMMVTKHGDSYFCNTTSHEGVR